MLGTFLGTCKTSVNKIYKDPSLLATHTLGLGINRNNE